MPPSNEELQAQEDQRQAERHAALVEHNNRTGGGEVREGELQAQRDEHNRRTAGESSASVDEPQDDAPESEQA